MFISSQDPQSSTGPWPFLTYPRVNPTGPTRCGLPKSSLNRVTLHKGSMTAEPWSMALADVSSALGSVSLFSAFSKRQLRMIAESGREYKYKSGFRLVEAGATGDRFYLVLDGKVEIRKGGRVLAMLSRGQFFGELSLIDEKPWAADVIAVQPTHCLTLSKRVFSALTRRHPELVQIILKEVVRRLRVAEGHLVS